MITKLYLHELNMKNSNLFKNLDNSNLYKDTLMIEILDSYEIAFLINFNNDIILKDFLKQINVLNPEFNIDNVNNFNTYTLLFLENKGTYIKLTIKDGKVIQIYGKIIENSQLMKNLINILKFPTMILENNIEEEIIKVSLQNKIKNYYSFKEIDFYLELFNIHIGLTFYLIKHHLQKILKFLELNNKEIINKEDIVIQNSFSDLMNQKLKKRWRINKKHHVLNISNVKKFSNFQIFINKSNNKYYIKKNEEIFNIKNFMILNRKNILKIKEKYNRSNEILGIYEYNNYKYIIKITKSISKNLKEKLEPISIKEYINNL